MSRENVNLMGVGYLIESMSKRANKDQALDDLQSRLLEIESDLKKKIDEIESGLTSIHADTQGLTILKNKLMFIEQFYLKKTGFETEIDAKLGRVEQSVDALKRNMEGLMKDVKYVKEQINVIKAKPKGGCLWFWKAKDKNIKRQCIYKL
jgi:chromosome segregation ATPase